MFIAERFIYNLVEFLRIEKFEVEVNDDLFRRRKRPRWMPKGVWKRFYDESRNALEITEIDHVWRTVITSVMPHYVRHYNSKGQSEDGLDVFEYVETHFALANARTTPRALLIYLDKLIHISDAYYAERLYPKIPLNEDGEYPLFLREHIQKAYGELQIELSAYISSSVTHPEWKDRISSLMSNVGNRSSFSFRDLKRLIRYDDSDQDAKELLAFLEHLGVLHCLNKSVHLPDRRYEIPIILQRVA